MDHPEAIQLKAVERYVLGDLSVSEVEEFERHFFDCPQCSEELRTLSVLQENARAVFIEQTPGPRRETAKERASWWSGLASIWRQPWAIAPALAAVVAAILAGYQTGVHRQNDVPQAVSSYPLYAASRGEATVISPPPGAQFYTLYMDRTWDRDFTAYSAVVRDDPGQSEFYSMRFDKLAPGQSIQVLIPIHALRSGRYVLVISGVDQAGSRVEVARYPFTVKFN
jgi:hypothetical protein